MLLRLVRSALTATLFVSPGLAAEIRVPADHPTLVDAVMAAVDGDVILLADGDWAGAGFRDVDLLGKRIAVRSESDDPTRCRVRGGSSAVFKVANGETRETLVRGFTLHQSSHAIRIDDASPTIERCVFMDNGGQVTGGGAAIRIHGGAPLVEGCTFRTNVFYGEPGEFFVGGAVSVLEATPTLVNCLFDGNRAVSLFDASGGALANRRGGHSLLIHCTFVRNALESLNNGCLEGGAVSSDPRGSATLVGCIVWDNDGPAVIGPVAASSTDVQGGLPGPGNLDVDPAFLGADDFRLRPDSPLIDAGDPADLPVGVVLDLDGAARVVNVRPDLGAFENQAPEPTTYCTAGVNSGGSPARIGSRGSTSIASNDFGLEASDNPAGAVGLFYYGPVQLELPFGDGARCVGAGPGGSTFRLQPPLVADASGRATRAIDFTSPPLPAGQIDAGSQWNFQWWYRDPAAGGSGFNLSEGLAATFR